jgi:hypothetical protein
MTPVDLMKESTKYAGEALKALSKSKSGDIAQTCSLFRLQIFFADKAWEKLSAAQQVELYKRNLAKGSLDSLQKLKSAFRQYCPGSKLLTGKASVLAMPPEPSIPLPASEKELGHNNVECTPAGSLRCQLEALEKVGPGARAAEAVLPTAPNASPLRPAPGLRPAPSAGNRNSQSTPARSAQSIEPEPLRFDQSLNELVRQGVVSPDELRRIRSGATATGQQSPAHRLACLSGGLSEQECNTGVVVRWRGTSAINNQLVFPVDDGLPSVVPSIKPLSSREQALLHRIRSGGQAPQWRAYGQCSYDWAGWKLQSNGIRTTAAYCGDSARRWTVGVSCDRLLVAVHNTESGWSEWKRPAGPDNKARQGEDEMVAALCANAGVSPR